MKVRARDCRDCAYLWVAPVMFSNSTPNISGERTEFCPKCGSRSVNSGLQQDWTELIPELEGTVAVLTLRTREHAALSSLLDAAMSAFAGTAGGTLHGLLGQVNEVDPLAEQQEEKNKQIDMLVIWFDENFNADEQGALQVQLDDIVHDIASKGASSVNNGGVLDQLNYIFMELGPDAQEVISEAWKDWAKKYPLPLREKT